MGLPDLPLDPLAFGSVTPAATPAALVEDPAIAEAIEICHDTLLFSVGSDRVHKERDIHYYAALCNSKLSRCARMRSVDKYYYG